MTYGAIRATFAPDLFASQSVLVSGGTSGIGNAIAQGFATLGAHVVATGVNSEEVANAKPCHGSGQIEYRLLDVRDDGGVTQLISSMPALTAVINCAGIIRRHDELEPEAFADTLEVNLTGTMRVCAKSRKSLAREGGAIVNLASMLSFFGSAVAPGYAASKGGISQLTKSLAIAYAQDGIRVNAIAPGWIETPLTRSIKGTPQYFAIQDRTAQKMWGRAEDLVGAAIFLSSPAASYITGAILPVDGGFLAV